MSPLMKGDQNRVRRLQAEFPFVLVYPSRFGPVIKRVADSRAFEGYVMAWKHAAGPQSATWLNPFTVQAHA